MTTKPIRFPEVLLVLRHGQTAWNLERRLQGRIDIPLNETGRLQAATNGRTLAALLKREEITPESVQIFSSPLSRTMQTAEIASHEAGLTAPINPEPRLIEQDFGLLQAMTHEEVQKKYPYCWYMRQHKPLSYLPPLGESGAAFQERISSVIDASTGVTLLVGHFGLLRTLIALSKSNAIKTDLDFETLTGDQNAVYMVRNGVLTLHRASETK